MTRKRLIPYANALNPAQMEAVNFTEGPLLVIAGAGSGKTRTLTYRVARLVEDGVSPGAILLLTFTRKASFEMLKRASELLDQRCEMVAGGTFHSFANFVLRKYSSLVGFAKGFSILDSPDAQNLIGLLTKEMNVVSARRRFPRKQTLAGIFSRAANKVIPVETVIENDYPHFAPFVETIEAIEDAYRVHKRRHFFFDYDDLLIYLKVLLEEHPDVRNRLSSAYRFLMVDEYQDTNQIQADIVRMLADVHSNVMVVGDDSQSIYGFRGANFKNIMKFPDIFPGTRIIKLEENYRSAQPILNLTNTIISRASEKYSKVLFSSVPGKSLPMLVCARNENSQSKFVVSKISELRQSRVPLNQIAVLFRAGFHSFDLEIELARSRVPFVKVGGFKFNESAHIKDVLAHLRILANPSDRISWLRVLQLCEGVGPKTAQRVYDALSVEPADDSAFLTANFGKPVERRLKGLKTLFSRIDPARDTVEQLGTAVLNYYAPILNDRYDDFPKRTRDLEHLLTIMARYGRIESFLSDMALEPPNTSADDSFSVGVFDDDRLTLSTIHSAKGLEWHTVFIIWALDGRFPSVHSLKSDDEIEEELRLMYVAATRSRQNLFITYPTVVYDRNSGDIFNRPSRFVDGIPDDILEKFSTFL